MRRATILLAGLLAACGSGREPPEGYVEACYGGDWNKYMVGKSPVYSVILDIDKSEWHKLATFLQAYSSREGLTHFDTSEESNALSMLYISLCSEHGLWVHADKRIWHFEGREEHSPLPLMVSVVVYANPDKWAHVPSDLDSELKKMWPGKVNSEHGIESSLRNSLL